MGCTGLGDGKGAMGGCGAVPTDTVEVETADTEGMVGLLEEGATLDEDEVECTKSCHTRLFKLRLYIIVKY